MGKVIGPAKLGRPETSSAPDITDGLSRDQRHTARLMAENEDVVDDVSDRRVPVPHIH